MNNAREEYIKLLKAHDWEYQHSDDHQVYLRGNRERSTLNAMQRVLDDDCELWNQHCHHLHRRKA